MKLKNFSSKETEDERIFESQTPSWSELVKTGEGDFLKSGGVGICGESQVLQYELQQG